MNVDCDITIIGAGVIGLAIASALSQDEQNIFILEKNASHGMGISSRNSEVIHAGIYYPPGSLKAKLCIEGREQLYETCAKHNIPHRKIGKLIIASAASEKEKLEKLMINAGRNGLSSVSLLEGERIGALEPNIRAVAALHSPDTGIVSVHHLMDYYLHSAKSRGAEIVCGTHVRGIEKVANGYRITTVDSGGERFEIVSERVVNAAGLHADEVAGMLGSHYSQFYCKGDYFSINNVKKGTVQRLIYPVPEEAGLGVHLTLDLSGRMRLGPDATYIQKTENYHVDAGKKEAFYQAAVKYLPFIQRDDIAPDMSGIRPKLQAPGEDHRDFVISEDHPGFVNLVGIESPGLTAAPAIASHVRALLTGAPAAA